jgi:hypothetical protein
VTTIQCPTPQIKHLAAIPGWKLVVVGDKKTPKDWHVENCEYLSPERQLELGYETANLLPWNSYSRKNIGYLYAIENGAKIIYETDDDNQPIGELLPEPVNAILPECIVHGKLVNIYPYFGQPNVWPRGFPLQNITSSGAFELSSPSACEVGVEQGLVNGDPDVDAIFRLTQDRPVEFEPRPTFQLPVGVFCPFNTQNTFFHEKAFFTMYIPSTITMRVCDIWKGYIAQRLLWEIGTKLIFSGPNAIQARNAHDLFKDYLQEQDIYLKAANLIQYLSEWQSPTDHAEDMFLALYQELVRENYYSEQELDIVDAWVRDLKRLKCSF